MLSYNLITLDASKMVNIAENYKVEQISLPDGTKGKWKVLYHYDLSKTDSKDNDIILSEEPHDDNAFFYQLIQCIKETDEKFKSLNLEVLRENPDILRKFVIFVDFKKVFGLSGKSKSQKTYNDSTKEDLESNEYRIQRVEWLFDPDNGGIEICFEKDTPITFVPFDRSPSMSRSSQISFIRKDLKEIADKRLLLGIDVSPLTMIHSKYYAYRGLYLSTGYRIEQNEELFFDENTVIVLPDDKTTVTSKFFTTKKEEAQENGLWECSLNKEDTEADQTSFDGEGLIASEYAKKISKQLRTYNFRRSSHSFQIRMPFIKGMLHEVEFKFFDEQLKSGGIDPPESIFVKDVFEIQRDLRKAEIILTKSMFKFAGWLKKIQELLEKHSDKFKDENFRDERFAKEFIADPMKFFFSQMKKFSHTLYITGSDARLSNNGTTPMNYQFLTTLRLDFKSFNLLVENQLEKVKENSVANFRKNALSKIFTYESIDKANSDAEVSTDPWEIIEDDTTKENDGEGNGNAIHSENVHEKCLAALRRNGGFFTDPQVRGTLERIATAYERSVCFGRFTVAGEQRYLSRDLLGFLIFILESVKDNKEKSSDIDGNKLSDLINSLKKQCLRPEKFYLPRNSNSKINWDFQKNYAILRNPHLSRNEQCLLKPYIKKDSIYEKYFGKLNGIIMVAYKSLVPMALSGADFDGDIVKIIVDEIVVKAIEFGVYNKEVQKFLEEKREHITISIRNDEMAVIKIPSPKAAPKTFPQSVPFENIQDTFSNKVGLISNLAIKATAYEYGCKSVNYPQFKDFCATATIITGLEIDAAKTSKHPTANIKELSGILSGKKEEKETETLPPDQQESEVSGKSIFLDVKKGMEKLDQQGLNYTPQVRKSDDGKLSMFLSTKSKEAVKYIEDIEDYDENSFSDNEQPLSMIDCLPGRYLKYLKEKQDKKHSIPNEENPDEQKNDSKSFPRNRIHYCFQIQKDWKDNLNQQQLEEVKKLINGYIQLKNLARQMSIMKNSETSKYFGYIITILKVQYDDITQPFSETETQSVSEVFREMAYIDIANIFKDKENALNSVNDSLKRLVEEKWQLTPEEKKEAKLAKILDIDDVSQQLSATSIKLLSNFSNNGFMLLYYILKNIQNEYYKVLDPDSYVDNEKEKNEDDAKFVRPKDNSYFDDMYEIYSKSHTTAKKIWHNKIIQLCREHLQAMFGDMSLALKYVVANSGADTRHEFFWNIFTADEILWNVYSGVRVRKKIKRTDLLKEASFGNIDALKKLGEYCLESDTVRAVMCYRKLADLGDTDAPAKIIECYEKATERGEKNAFYNLYLIYNYGYGVDRNEQKAAEFLEKFNASNKTSEAVSDNA